MSRNRQSTTRRTPLVDIPLRSPLFGLAQDHAPQELIPPHHHDSDQLIYASVGVVTVETEDGFWVVPPARAVWVPAGITHSILMSGRVEFRSLYLAPALAPIEGTHCCVVQVSPLLRSAILRVMEFSHPYPQQGSEARLVEVILDEIQLAEVAPLHLPMPSDERARRVALAFRNDPTDRRSRQAWAHVAGTSERTLERLFHAEVGTSFGKWQRQTRLLAALEFLAAGQSVTNAALDVGFQTPSAFITMFRRAMGTTPARYFAEGPRVEEGAGADG